MPPNGIENSSHAPFTGRVFVIAKHQELLRQLGLDTMEGVKKFKGELIKNHKGRRDIQSIEHRTAENNQPPLVLFLKRNWKPYRKDGLKSLLSRGEAWSQSRVEWENLLALQRAGIGVAEPVAFGEECGPFWEKFSFIITAGARGDLTVDQFLRTCTDADERRRVTDALAVTVRKMHDAGLASPDLFTRHIFLERGPEPKFCLIDMARLDRRRSLSPRLRARDLAALNVTAPLRFVSARERSRFFQIYGGDAFLKDLERKRTEHLLKRKKFAEFSETASRRNDSQ
jgi:tRNA A-37 threonylcarbamoyl transferase component Bud32